MTTASQLIKDKAFWLQFIKEYEKLPCLWKESHVNYSNRKVREQAFNTLLKKVRQIWPDVQLDFVKHRLNNFKRTFKNEYTKVEDSKKNGGRKYVPSLFYYNHLKFLAEDKVTQSPEPSFDETSEEGSQFELGTAKEDECQSDGMPTSGFNDVDFIITSKDGSPSSPNEFYLIPSNNEVSRPSKRQRLLQEPSEDNTDEVGSSKYHLQEISETIVPVEPQDEIPEIEKRGNELLDMDAGNIAESKNVAAPFVPVSYDDDEFDIIAKRVAMHLRKMNQQQCLYAEKLVFDVCINGRLNRLREDSSLSVLSSCQNNEENFFF